MSLYSLWCNKIWLYVKNSVSGHIWYDVAGYLILGLECLAGRLPNIKRRNCKSLQIHIPFILLTNKVTFSIGPHRKPGDKRKDDRPTFPYMKKSPHAGLLPPHTLTYDFLSFNSQNADICKIWNICKIKPPIILCGQGSGDTSPHQDPFHRCRYRPNSLSTDVHNHPGEPFDVAPFVDGPCQENLHQNICNKTTISKFSVLA